MNVLANMRFTEQCLNERSYFKNLRKSRSASLRPVSVDPPMSSHSLPPDLLGKLRSLTVEDVARNPGLREALKDLKARVSTTGPKRLPSCSDSGHVHSRQPGVATAAAPRKLPAISIARGVKDYGIQYRQGWKPLERDADSYAGRDLKVALGPGWMGPAHAVKTYERPLGPGMT